MRDLQTVTTIMEIGLQTSSSSSQQSQQLGAQTFESFAQQALDRLEAYGGLMGPVNAFSAAYDVHFRHHFKVIAYTHYKLVMAYGARRELFFVLTYRPKAPVSTATGGGGQFTLTFSHGIPCSEFNSDAYPPALNFNPHSYVAHMLVEEFNKSPNLTDLCQYLMSTWRALASLLVAWSGPSKADFHPRQNVHDRESVVAPSLLLSTISLTEFSLSIDHNACVTFKLVDGAVIVRDRTGSIPGLLALFRRVASDLSLSLGYEPEEQSAASPSADEHATSTARKSIVSASPNPPASFPAHHQDMPSASPMAAGSRSVPSALEHLPPAAAAPSEKIEPQTDGSDPLDRAPSQLSTTVRPITVPVEAFERALRRPYSGARFNVFASPPFPRVDSPLEELLHWSVVARRLGSVLEHTRSLGAQFPPIKQIVERSGWLRCSLDTVVPGLFLRFTAYYDPAQLKMVTSIQYVSGETLEDARPTDDGGSIAPSDVAVLEEFAEKHVLRTSSAVSLLSLLCACRVTTHSFLHSIAELCRATLDTLSNSPSPPMNPALPSHHRGWRATLQLHFLNQSHQHRCFIMLQPPTIHIPVKIERYDGSHKKETRVVRITHNYAKNVSKANFGSLSNTDEHHNAILEQCVVYANVQAENTGRTQIHMLISQLMDMLK